MRNIFKTKYLLLATAALVAVSCYDTKEDIYEPADPDSSSCYGVYFPTQEASGSHTYDPQMDPSVEITIARDNTTGSITVPVVAKTTAAGSEVEGIFNVGTATFVDGQSEATIDVTFPNAAEGIEYSLTLSVEDNAYASIYSNKSSYLTFSVLRVKWEYFLNPVTGEKAKVHFVQGWWGEEVDAYIKYYEVDGVRTCFTETIPDSHYYNGPYTGYGFFGTGEEEGDGYEWTFTWYPSEKNSLGGQFIKLNLAPCYVNSNYGALVYANDYFCHYAWANPSKYADYETDWLSYAKKYGDPTEGDTAVSYYDGNGGFFFNVFRYYMDGIGGWNPGDYDTYGISEGFVRTDYSIKDIVADFTQEGVLPLSFYVGNDVKKIDFIVASGELTSPQVSNQASAIAAGSAENVYSLTELVETQYDDADVLGAEAEVTLESTGVYTVVAVTYDAEGGLADYSSAVVKYVAAGDEEENAVVLNCGIGSAAKFVGQGYNTDTALEVWAYGSDIVDAKIAAVKYVDLVSNKSAALEAVKKSASISADDLAALNGDGYVSVADKLLPGTQYFTVVWASNGYEEDFFISDEGFYTTGDPLPIYQNYTLNDFNVDLAPEKSEGFFGTYNFYAINFFDNETGLRDYAGKVTIADSDVPDSEPDDDGLVDEYIEISGMFADAAKRYGFKDTQLWDFYDGFIYNLGAEGQQLGATSGGNYYAQLFVLTSAGSIYRGYPSMLIGGFVDDGYIAIMSSELYNGGSLGENGLFLRFYSDEGYNSIAGNVGGWSDLMLVDPAKDDNGIAPSAAAVQARSAQIRTLQNQIREGRTNYVETPRGYMRSLIDKNRNAAKPVQVNGTKVVDGTCPVKTVSAEVSVKAPKAVIGSHSSKKGSEQAIVR